MNNLIQKTSCTLQKYPVECECIVELFNSERYEYRIKKTFSVTSIYYTYNEHAL